MTSSRVPKNVPKNVLGSTIDRLRKKLGLTHSELAELLGVATSTTYRWISKKKIEVPVEPLQRALLAYVEEVMSWPPDKRASKIRSIKRALGTKGNLAALGELLKELGEPLLARRPRA